MEGNGSDIKEFSDSRETYVFEKKQREKEQPWCI